MAQDDWLVKGSPITGGQWGMPTETAMEPMDRQSGGCRWPRSTDPGTHQGWMPAYGKSTMISTHQYPQEYQSKGDGEPGTADWRMKGTGNKSQMGRYIWHQSEHPMSPKGSKLGMENRNPVTWNWEKEPRWHNHVPTGVEVQGISRAQQPILVT